VSFLHAGRKRKLAPPGKPRLTGLGCFVPTINAIETNREDPGLPLVYKIAHLFKWPIEEILTDGG
jgi:hypothetical protein